MPVAPTPHQLVEAEDAVMDLKSALREGHAMSAKLLKTRTVPRAVTERAAALIDDLEELLEQAKLRLKIMKSGCRCPNPMLHQELAGDKPIDTSKCVDPTTVG
jgi:hypothetical protein